MIKHILSSLLAVVAVGSFTLTAAANESIPYDAATFEQARAEGKTVLVDFAASWCSTCRKQGPVIASLLKQEKFKDVVAFKADYDAEKELRKELKVASQSTLVVFKGKSEVARAAGITAPEAIDELLSKGI